MLKDFAFLIFLLFLACSTPALAAHGTDSPQGRPLNIQVHGGGKVSSNITMLDLLKKQRLTNYPTATIGKAFDDYKYFSKIRWKEYPAAYGKTYFDFTAEIRKKWFGLDKSWDGVAFRELEVKFVLEPDGDYGVVMATRIDVRKDGKIVRSPVSLKVLLDSVYASRELSF